MAFFRKARVRRRVRKALKKYVRGNSGVYKTRRSRERGRFAKAPAYTNPARVKGRKVKGGRAVTVRNFTGTIVKKSDGTVQIVGKGRRK